MQISNPIRTFEPAISTYGNVHSPKLSDTMLSTSPPQCAKTALYMVKIINNLVMNCMAKFGLLQNTLLTCFKFFSLELDIFMEVCNMILMILIENCQQLLYMAELLGRVPKLCQLWIILLDKFILKYKLTIAINVQ